MLNARKAIRFRCIFVRIFRSPGLNYRRKSTIFTRYGVGSDRFFPGVRFSVCLKEKTDRRGGRPVTPFRLNATHFIFIRLLFCRHPVPV